MTNQNWVLQQHYHAQNGTTNLTIQNVNGSQQVVDDSGQATYINNGNFPVYRLVMKVTFEVSNMNSYNYLIIRFGGNSSSWDNAIIHRDNANTYFANQTSGSYGTDTTYSRQGLSFGHSVMGSQYSGYQWGSTVTATDGTSVPSTDIKRWAPSVIDMNTYHQNTNWFPGSVGSAASVYNGVSASNVTSDYSGGAFGFGSCGTSSSNAFNNIEIASSYNMRGDFLLYRAGISDYVGGS